MHMNSLNGFKIAASQIVGKRRTWKMKSLERITNCKRTLTEEEN